MRKTLAALVATTGLLAAAPAALANQTVQIPSFNCSVTAYTPSRYLNGETALGGVSCGGTQANYSKNVQTSIYQLIPGGWSVVTGTPWNGWTTINPLQYGVGAGPCVPGRWYATVAQGEISHSGTASLVTASTFGSGWQCP